MKIKKYHHRKLVRDNIPNIIKSRGGAFEMKTASASKVKLLLRRKLVEESKEIIKASKDSLLGELSDVMQLIISIGESEKLSLKEILKKTKEKEKYAGAYKKRIFLVWSDKPQGFGDKKKK